MRHFYRLGLRKIFIQNRTPKLRKKNQKFPMGFLLL
jgi:hypothetical protein